MVESYALENIWNLEALRLAKAILLDPKITQFYYASLLVIFKFYTTYYSENYIYTV